MILLDTTVLVYAVGSDHALREPCRRLITAIGEGQLAATTTVEVIQEFTHVRARRRGRPDTRAIAGHLANLLAPLVQPDADDLELGLNLFVEHETIGAFDAMLAATVQRRDYLSGLVSTDTGFSTLPGLLHHDPSAPVTLEQLLG